MMTFARGEVSWKWRLQKCVTLSIIEIEYISTTKTSKELKCVALSIIEAEYISITQVFKELLWMKKNPYKS